MIKARGKRITTTREGKAVDTHHMMGHAGQPRAASKQAA